MSLVLLQLVQEVAFASSSHFDRNLINFLYLLYTQFFERLGLPKVWTNFFYMKDLALFQFFEKVKSLPPPPPTLLNLICKGSAIRLFHVGASKILINSFLVT